MLPRFDPCPPSGGGVHTWLLSQANRCRLGGLEPATTHSVLREGSRRCGRIVPEGEIEAAVHKAFASDWTPGCSVSPVKAPLPKWPPRDKARIAEITTPGRGLADLWEASPIRFEDEASHTEALIDVLFPGKPLLCCGRSKLEFDTRPRSAWAGKLAALQLIVPSPMCAILGETQEGRPSKHSLANTGPRRFLVVEFDDGGLDDQAALLLHLGRFAPLVLALFSGGKSLHGWFLVADQPEDKVRRFFRYAVALGADRALWNRTQFVRMPDGVRANGQPQTVFFFNPRPLDTHARNSA